MKNKAIWDAVIIGGGAAGITAAIAAAEMGDRVLILEKMDRIGKKIMATGNGRCNLLNTGKPLFFGGERLASAVLSLVPASLQWAWWQTHGLSLREEEGGRVYPVSGHASSVLDVLRLWIEKLDVHVETGVTVTGLMKTGGLFTLQGLTADGEAPAWVGRRVILATGGMAQPKLGSDGSGYALAASQGHEVSEPRPALTQIETEKPPIAGLSGIRVKASVSVLQQGKKLYGESGELLFTDYGVSGVCVMQCAQAASVPGALLEICLTGGMGFSSAEELTAELHRRRGLFPRASLDTLLSGLCVHALSLAIFRQADVKWHGRLTGSLSDREIRHIAGAASRFPLAVRRTRGFDTCQVTAGGVRWDEVRPETMASTLMPGLHLAGEILDVDGDCGGHNLMFAVGSGMLAGYNGRMKWNGEYEHDHS